MDTDGNYTNVVRKILVPQTPKNVRDNIGLMMGKNVKSTPRRRRRMVKQEEKNQRKIPQLFPKDTSVKEGSSGGIIQILKHGGKGNVFQTVVFILILVLSFFYREYTLEFIHCVIV